VEEDGTLRWYVVAAFMAALAWVIGLVLATVALARWGRARAVLLGALFATPLVLPVAAYGATGLTSTTCPDDKLRAYREFADSGEQGSAPYDCRTF
jgi:hypothetical protein